MAKATAPAQTITIDVKPLLGPLANIVGAIIIAAAILISGSLYGGKTVTTTPTTTGTGTTTPPTTTGSVTVSLSQIQDLAKDSNNIVFGNKDSKVIFVEVSDPSCPFCHIAGGDNPDLNSAAGAQFKLASQGGSYVPPVAEMRKLVDQGKAAFVWIYTNGHGNGKMGTQALYCANEQGKFWAVHDLLMSREGYKIQNGYDIDQSTISADKVVGNDQSKSALLADFLKSAVDPSAMKSCLDSQKYVTRLDSDIAKASSLGVSGTPGFFVNETNFAGAYSFADMQATVNKYI
jgi:protein-disulfide isomerase